MTQTQIYPIEAQLRKWLRDPTPLLFTGPREDDPAEIFNADEVREVLRLMIHVVPLELLVKSLAACIARARMGTRAGKY